MNDILKKLIITTVIVLGVVYLISSNYYRILYTADLARSFIIDIKESISPSKSSFTIDIPGSKKKYILNYRKMADGFSYNAGVLIYKSIKRESLENFISRTIAYTNFYKTRIYRRELIKVNSIYDKIINKNRFIIIPNILPSIEKNPLNFKKPKIIHTKGIYLTGWRAGSLNLHSFIKKIKSLGINTIVFDAKDVTGVITYNSNLTIVNKFKTDRKRSIGNIKILIKLLKFYKIQSVARIAVFQDRALWKSHPSLAIRSKRTGAQWKTGRELWLDPTNKTVQDYNISIALELCDLGVDEIQFDYIRFPTSGNQRDIVLKYHFGKKKRETTITEFLKRAYTKISKKNTLLSIDIFGVVAWNKEIDIKRTGQRVHSLAKYCDIISPMLYPSHFSNNFDGRAYPGDHPYYYINEGCKKVTALAKNGVAVRPWLQAFRWRVSNYNASYIIKQIKGSDDSGAKGYLFWSASNNYKEVYEALRILKLQKYNK